MGQLVIWLWVPVVYGTARLPPIALTGYLLAMVWTADLFTAALRRNEVTTRWVLADAAGAVAWAVVVSRAFPAGQAASPRNWVLGRAGGHAPPSAPAGQVSRKARIPGARPGGS